MPKRHKPPTLQLRNSPIETVEEFAAALFWKSPSRQIAGAEVLKKIKDGSVDRLDMKDLAEELDIKLNDFYAIVRELKRFGVIYKKNGLIRWSVQFQNKLARLSEFYANYAGKKNPYQKALDMWEKLAEGDIIIKPKYEED
jgi:hypothetical protein